MKISLIAAMTKNRVIGKNNAMPWHLPADLRHFKQITHHKPIVMGRKTFESIGRALPERRNIVVSRQLNDVISGLEVYPSLERVWEALKTEQEVLVIGGQTLFEETLAMADRLYLTLIDVEMEGDTFFPAWDPKQWHVVSRESHRADEKNPWNYEFLELKRLP